MESAKGTQIQKHAEHQEGNSKGKRRRRNQIKKRKEQTEKDLDSGITKVPDYIIKGGLRFVEKYTHVFRSFMKDRWVGQQILPLMVKEFKMDRAEGTSIYYILEYFTTAIKEAKIKINGLPTTPDYVLQRHDQLSKILSSFSAHYMDRIEIPVINQDIEIVAETPDYIISSCYRLTVCSK